MNMSRERSRSEFKHGYDHKSPCVPPNRRIKSSPSPVVLCVPRAPHPPPPSPVGDSRKHKGFPTVRYGSSRWGGKGWFHYGINFELAYVTFPLQPPESQNNSPDKASLPLVHDILHDEINSFCKQVAAVNLVGKPYINWAVKRVARSLQVLWPRSRTSVYGSNATGLSLPSSDVDLVVSLPLEPIKEVGILEERNGIKETCLQRNKLTALTPVKSLLHSQEMVYHGHVAECFGRPESYGRGVGHGFCQVGRTFQTAPSLVATSEDFLMVVYDESQVAGKDIIELIATGREKLASVPAVGGAVAVSAPSGGGGAATPAVVVEAKKKEKLEEKKSEDDMGFEILFILN
ncbi:hypothetical protein OROHE_004859 [Orobanche hederae]